MRDLKTVVRCGGAADGAGDNVCNEGSKAGKGLRIESVGARRGRFPIALG